MVRGAFTRWLYRGQRPNRIARFANRIWASLGASGLTPSFLVTLEVIGRRTGRPSRFPMVMVVVDGQRYLVSMLGEHVAWVRNLRAAGGRAVLQHGRRAPVRLEDVPAERRAPILKRYLQRAPGARPHIPVDKDAPLEEFERIAPTIPVFRVLLDSQGDSPSAEADILGREDR